MTGVNGEALTLQRERWYLDGSSISSGLRSSSTLRRDRVRTRVLTKQCKDGQAKEWRLTYSYSLLTLSEFLLWGY